MQICKYFLRSLSFSFLFSCYLLTSWGFLGCFHFPKLSIMVKIKMLDYYNYYNYIHSFPHIHMEMHNVHIVISTNNFMWYVMRHHMSQCSGCLLQTRKKVFWHLCSCLLKVSSMYQFTLIWCVQLSQIWKKTCGT